MNNEYMNSNTSPVNDPDYVKKMKQRYQEAYVRMVMEESLWQKGNGMDEDVSAERAGDGEEAVNSETSISNTSAKPEREQ